MSFSNPDQVARFAEQKRSNCIRALDIDKLYKGDDLKGKVVLVTGSNRGIGLALCKELVAQGAKVIASCRKSKPALEGLYKVIDGIDVVDDSAMGKLVKALAGQEIDILINNAGYFMVEEERVTSMNFKEQMKMIDICALGPLRVTSALFNAKLIKAGAKVAMITSQGGSIAWREVQNGYDGPYDYGHHMSKAAANMGARLLSLEMKQHNILVTILHPGFNRTDMTSKYKHIWDVEGAVDSSIGAKRVLHEINILTEKTAGQFINCEDGLQIPW